MKKFLLNILKSFLVLNIISTNCVSSMKLQNIELQNFLDENFNENLSDELAKKSDDIFKDLSCIDKDAICNYTGPNSVSDFLKGKKFSKEFSKILKLYTVLISNMINKNHLEEDIYLFQGNFLHCLNDLFSKTDIDKITNAYCESDILDILKNLNGKVFSTNDFSSTSTYYYIAKSFADYYPKDSENPIGVILIISAKKGLPYLPIMHHSVFEFENEVLLDRNLKFKIKNARFEINPFRFNFIKKCLFIECDTILPTN